MRDLIFVMRDDGRTDGMMMVEKLKIEVRTPRRRKLGDLNLAFEV